MGGPVVSLQREEGGWASGCSAGLPEPVSSLVAGECSSMWAQEMCVCASLGSGCCWGPSVAQGMSSAARVHVPGLRPDLPCALHLPVCHPLCFPPPQPHQDLPAPSKRRAAVITLGQICQSAGCVMTPYWDFPQLLSLLLRLLHEGNLAKGRCEVMRVLGECV